MPYRELMWSALKWTSLGPCPTKVQMSEMWSVIQKSWVLCGESPKESLRKVRLKESVESNTLRIESGLNAPRRAWPTGCLSGTLCREHLQNRIERETEYNALHRVQVKSHTQDPSRMECSEEVRYVLYRISKYPKKSHIEDLRSALKKAQVSVLKIVLYNALKRAQLKCTTECLSRVSYSKTKHSVLQRCRR